MEAGNRLLLFRDLLLHFQSNMPTVFGRLWWEGARKRIRAYAISAAMPLAGRTLACIFLAGLAGCSDSRPAKSTQVGPAKGTFAYAAGHTSDVWPLADGCAYIRAITEAQLWYVCEGTAVKVTGEPLPDLADIYPMADGGALLAQYGGSMIWLKGATATLVKESNSTPKRQASINPSGFYFAAAAAKSQAKKLSDLDSNDAP